MNRGKQVQNEAAAWIVRRETSDWSARDQAALEAWLAESDSNKAAYWRLKLSWAQADRIGSLGVASGDFRHRDRWRRGWQPIAIAASLALVVSAGVFRYGEYRQPPAPTTLRYETPVGGQRAIALGDGSQIDLNTRTVLRAAVSANVRQVWLDTGEAFFQVTHDAAHPFVIFAGPKRITVLGTKFAVRRDGAKVSVSVLEGRVRIDDAGSSASESSSSATLTRGVLAVSQGPSTLVVQRSETRVMDALAWRDGRLKFDQTPLSEVVAEFNRYNRRQIIVSDPQAAGIRIGGTFQASNVEAFARLLRDAYGLKISSETEVITISS